DRGRDRRAGRGGTIRLLAIRGWPPSPRSVGPGYPSGRPAHRGDRASLTGSPAPTPRTRAVHAGWWHRPAPSAGRAPSDRMGHPLSQPPGIHEDQAGSVLAHEVSHPVVDVAPNRIRGYRTQLVLGNFDGQIHPSPMTDIHNAQRLTGHA